MIFSSYPSKSYPFSSSFPGPSGIQEYLYCLIYFDDNGIGFDEIYLKRIFKPFHRLHGKEDYGGVGMGLAICSKVVEHHKGSITAKSTPGEGSTFIVNLPVNQVKAISSSL